MDDKKYSIKTVVLTAAISFLISGVGGALLSEWLSRAKPLITIGSVGFVGSEKQVQISDSFITTAAKSGWIRRYRKFEAFNSIAEDHDKADLVKKRLERGLALVDAWLKLHKSEFSSTKRPLTLEELSATPYMVDEIVGSSLNGMARRGELLGVPVRLSDFVSSEPVTEIKDDGKNWLLYMGDFNVAFPYSSAKTETEKTAIKLMAYSFAHGIGPNIVHYLRSFQTAANRDIRELIAVKEQLEKAMLPSTKLSITAAIFNSGRKPLVVKPYALLEVLNDDVEQKNHLMKVRIAVDDGNTRDNGELQDILQVILSRGDHEAGVDVVAESFLPETEGSSYVLVPPNGSVQINLTSVEELGNGGTRLRAIFDANVLRCRLSLHDVSGNALRSDALIFGSSVDADLKQELFKP